MLWFCIRLAFGFTLVLVFTTIGTLASLALLEMPGDGWLVAGCLSLFAVLIASATAFTRLGNRALRRLDK